MDPHQYLATIRWGASSVLSMHTFDMWDKRLQSVLFL